MTELNLAYGMFQEEEPVHQPPPKKEYIDPSEPIYKQPVQMEPPQQHKPMQVVDTQPSYKYTNNSKYNTQSYSFWDRMIISKNDVIKLAAFSLVILLGISFDKIISYYLNKYLSDNIFTTIQEFIVRLAYPIAVFLLLWIIKSL
jgi:hypothetical protein